MEGKRGYVSVPRVTQDNTPPQDRVSKLEYSTPREMSVPNRMSLERPRRQLSETRRSVLDPRLVQSHGALKIDQGCVISRVTYGMCTLLCSRCSGYTS